MESLTFIDVTKRFTDGLETITALQSTQFSIQPGEFVALIGPSGSGKSTFLTLAGGLQTPTSGTLLINGRSYNGLSEKKRASLRFNEIGFILQSSNLIPFLTVEQQLILVDKINKKSNEAYQGQLLEDLNITALAKKFPQELSGGERQRVAIARALYNDPAIILADEPTASLDSERAFEVVDILFKESKGKNKATIMVTHDQRMIEKCDAVYEMKDGVLSRL